MLSSLKTSHFVTESGMEHYSKAPPPTPIESTWVSDVHTINLSLVRDRLEHDDTDAEDTYDTAEEAESYGPSRPNSPPGLCDLHPAEHIMPPGELNRVVEEEEAPEKTRLRMAQEVLHYFKPRNCSSSSLPSYVESRTEAGSPVEPLPSLPPPPRWKQPTVQVETSIFPGELEDGEVELSPCGGIPDCEDFGVVFKAYK